MTHKFPLFEEFHAAVETALLVPLISLVTRVDRSLEIDKAFGDSARLGESQEDLSTYGAQQVSRHLLATARETTLSHCLLGTPLNPHLAALRILRNALGKETRVRDLRFSDPHWLQALRHAMTTVDEEDPGNSRSVPNPSFRDYTFAKAVIFFAGRNVQIRLTGDKVSVNPGVLAAVVREPLRALGGQRAFHHIDAAIAARYMPNLRRIRLQPAVSPVFNKMDRSIPYGYLYRLGLNALSSRGQRSETQKRYRSAETAAMHLAALFDVEHFSPYDDMFNTTPDEVIAAMRRVVTRDELFSVPQCNPDTMSRLLQHMFVGEMTYVGSRGVTWTIADIRKMWGALLVASDDDARSTFLDRKSLIEVLGVHGLRPAVAEGLLNSFVMTGANGRYHSPRDAEIADTKECSLVEATGGKIWIAPRLFLGPAFFSRLTTLLASGNDDLNEKMGIAFEEHVCKRLDELRIPYARGAVAGQKGQRAGELDLVIEGRDVVVLLELKKKGLTRKTVAGNDLHMIIDLTQGLIRAVNQLAKMEVVLLRDDVLRFENGSIIERRGRRIVKAVISLADYGGLHEQALMQDMLGSLGGRKINATIPISEVQERTVAQVNVELEKLSENYWTYAKYVGEKDAEEFVHNVLFRNIFFVEHVLGNARDANGFIDNLLLAKNMVTGLHDPILDHVNLTGLLSNRDSQ